MKLRYVSLNEFLWIYHTIISIFGVAHSPYVVLFLSLTHKNIYSYTFRGGFHIQYIPPGKKDFYVLSDICKETSAFLSSNIQQSLNYIFIEDLEN